MIFPFEAFSVDARPNSEGILWRGARNSEAVAHLVDPMSEDRNLASHVSVESLKKILREMARVRDMLAGRFRFTARFLSFDIVIEHVSGLRELNIHSRLFFM